jgi:hypothetical protein
MVVVLSSRFLQFTRSMTASDKFPSLQSSKNFCIFPLSLELVVSGTVSPAPCLPEVLVPLELTGVVPLGLTGVVLSGVVHSALPGVALACPSDCCCA